MSLKIGDRIQLSAHGLATLKREQRCGTIVGVGRDSLFWWVLWDGTHSRQSIGMVFVEPAREHSATEGS